MSTGHIQCCKSSMTPLSCYHSSTSKAVPRGKRARSLALSNPLQLCLFVNLFSEKHLKKNIRKPQSDPYCYTRKIYQGGQDTNTQEQTISTVRSIIITEVCLGTWSPPSLFDGWLTVFRVNVQQGLRAVVNLWSPEKNKPWADSTSPFVVWSIQLPGLFDSQVRKDNE